MSIKGGDHITFDVSGGYNNFMTYFPNEWFSCQCCIVGLQWIKVTLKYKLCRCNRCFQRESETERDVCPAGPEMAVCPAPKLG